MSTPSFAEEHPRKNPDAPFLVLGGFADFILPSTYMSAHGAIIGLANVAPVSVSFRIDTVAPQIDHPVLSQHATARLFELSQSTLADQSLLPEAQRLQGIVARGDFTIAKTGIPGTKFLLEKLYGYGGACRKPLPVIEPAAADALWAHPHTQELVRLERELSGKLAA